MKRILSLLLIITLMIGAMIPAASAEATLDGTTLQRNLVRAYGDGYEYFNYIPSAFNTAGVLSEKVMDLDNDQADELIRIELSADNLVYLIIYESRNGEWAEADFCNLYTASFTCNVQANDVFIKPVNGQWIIFNENWTQENCMADGAAWMLRAYAYDGSALSCTADMYVDGTDVFGTLAEWQTDDYLTGDRPELADYAQQLIAYDFDIEGVYWGSMICEQDTSVTMLSRVMSVQDIPYETVSDFISAGGSSLSGFRTMIVDCTLTDCTLPESYYLCNNEPAYADTPTFDFTGTGTALPEEEQNAEVGEYIIADSNVRALTAEELSAYDKDTLALIRNEILARYGYPFQKEKYREYFGSKSWYTRNENFNYSMLTSLEMENIELIKKLEAK